MRKIVYNLFIIISLFSCSMLLISCDAITAQNITQNGTSMPGINGGRGMNGGGPGMNGGPNGNQGNSRGAGSNNNQGMSGNARVNDFMNANLMGKIESVDGNLLTIELITQTQSSDSSNAGKQDSDTNKNNSTTKQSQRGSQGSIPEMNYTGTYKTITVNDDVSISQRQVMGRQNQNDNSNSIMKLSELKKDQIIAIWYKDNTETVEKISIIQ